MRNFEACYVTPRIFPRVEIRQDRDRVPGPGPRSEPPRWKRNERLEAGIHFPEINRLKVGASNPDKDTNTPCLPNAHAGSGLSSQA